VKETGDVRGRIVWIGATVRPKTLPCPLTTCDM